MSVPVKVLWLFLPVVLALGGPLLPGMAMILCPLLVALWARREWPAGDTGSTASRARAAFNKIPWEVFVYLGLLFVLCLYSLYIGRSNSENGGAGIGMLERFIRLFKGLFFMLADDIGLPLFLLGIFYNVFIINHQKTNQQALLLVKVFGLVFLFSAIYTLLLPFGGYREYRPYIARFDTMLPVTVFLVMSFAVTTTFVLKELPFGNKKHYTWGLIAFLLIFIGADRINWKKNDCQREALETLSVATQDTVLLNNDCNILSWGKIGEPRYSENVAQMLELWRVTSSKRLFYQK